MPFDCGEPDMSISREIGDVVEIADAGDPLLVHRQLDEIDGSYALRAGQHSQAFALMIGVSVGTLRNWEQGRRTPDGPALALLRVTAKNPRAVAEALHRAPRRGAA